MANFLSFLPILLGIAIEIIICSRWRVTYVIMCRFPFCQRLYLALIFQCIVRLKLEEEIRLTRFRVLVEEEIVKFAFFFVTGYWSLKDRYFKFKSCFPTLSFCTHISILRCGGRLEIIFIKVCLIRLGAWIKNVGHEVVLRLYFHSLWQRLDGWVEGLSGLWHELWCLWVGLIDASKGWSFLIVLHSSDWCGVCWLNGL